jgi:hypothetical protein
MVNKEFEQLKTEIKNNGVFLDTGSLKAILKKYKNLSATSKAWDYVLNEYYAIKIGSNKLGIDTAIYNVNNGLNCYSDKSGHCNHCNICYAKRDLNQYINSCLYNLSAEINFQELSIDKIISDIEQQIIAAKNEIKFIRISESGDITNYECLQKVIAISDYFYNKYRIISYTYTHNTELEIFYNEIKNSSLVLNYSYNTELQDVKKTMIIKKTDIHKYLDDPNYCICSGDCYHCSYCKDASDLRVVLFVNHKNKSTKTILKDVLTTEQLIKLESQKFMDYSKFLLKGVNNE